MDTRFLNKSQGLTFFWSWSFVLRPLFILHYWFCWSYECLRPIVDFLPNRTVFVRLWKSEIVDETGVRPYDQRTSFRTTFAVVRALIRRPPGSLKGLFWLAVRVHLLIILQVDIVNLLPMYYNAVENKSAFGNLTFIESYKYWYSLAYTIHVCCFICQV